MKLVKEQQQPALSEVQGLFSLMELYCGNANHSVALAPLFDTIFGVEINPNLIQAAKDNLNMNRIHTVDVVQGDCKEFCRQLTNAKQQRCHAGPTCGDIRVHCAVGTPQKRHSCLGPCQCNLNPTEKMTKNDIRTSVILVDPPRGGLDRYSKQFLVRFSHAVYISCNPESLLRDLESISRSHSVARFAFLDHFPYTKHVECAVLLIKREQGPPHLNS